ncbi:class I adenylate-forming enzyme family protein [Lentibacillus jeotgali]|uniref:class I adenylate-forming enzyme family protein n=1 Tax=Lentibacillus jeotgali TaxID=558169 RepID=UPI0002627845|nr:class I adenylate-forming enzyme family protein [Lentibacillus jeotgali]
MSSNQQTIPSVLERRRALEEQFPVWEKNSLATHFKKQCHMYHDRPLIVMPDHVMTYGEMWKRSFLYAKAFLSMGVKRRDHVAILMTNHPDYLALFTAASIVGAVVVPINTQLREEELTYIIRQSDTNWLLFHQFSGKKNHAEVIKRIAENLNASPNSYLKQVVCIPNADAPVPNGFIGWSDFISGADTVSDYEVDQRWQEVDEPDDCVAIIYTSGSTGLPKGVMLTDEMMLRSGFATCLSRAYEDGRRIFAPLPFYHVYFLQEGLFAVSFVGGTMVTCLGFSPLQAFGLMEKYQVHDFLAVPSMLVAMLNRSECKTFQLDHLYALLCCAAPSPVPLWKRAVEALQVTEIGTGCGGTEASSTTMLTEIGDSLDIISTKVGKIKLAGAAGDPEFGSASVMYKVIDPDTGADLPEGSVGELAVRGNVVTPGYYKNPEETAFAINHDGFLRSGDLGQIDKQGYIQLFGRSKDLYKVSGETVAPKEIEDVISLHSAVNQVYIIGVPDKLTTEAGAAFIELKQGVHCTKREIREWCKERVARFKIPRYVWFVTANDWPLTGTGKIQKFKLQTIAKEKLSKHAEDFLM